MKAKVKGIGGVFFKCKNPDEVKKWYKNHLGFNTDQYGTAFEWIQSEENKSMEDQKKGFTQWSPFKDDTKYLLPSEKSYMINYRVDNLEKLVSQLKKEGVTILDEIETFEYDKFVHILDIENNKIELWEPNDSEYDKILEVKTK